MYLNKMKTIHSLSWSCQSDLYLRSAMENTNTPLDGAYLADFGMDITPNQVRMSDLNSNSEMAKKPLLSPVSYSDFEHGKVLVPPLAVATVAALPQNNAFTHGLLFQIKFS